METLDFAVLDELAQGRPKDVGRETIAFTCRGELQAEDLDGPFGERQGVERAGIRLLQDVPQPTSQRAAFAVSAVRLSPPM